MNKAEQEKVRVLLKSRNFTDWKIDDIIACADNVVVLDGGEIFIINKPRIETEFCFGESGYDADEAAKSAERVRTDEDEFVRLNIEETNQWKRLHWLRTGMVNNRKLKLYKSPWHDGTYYLDWGGQLNEDAEELTDSDTEKLIEGYEKALENFGKRLRAYLKRYGLSKVHSWTYWRDA